MSRPVSSAAQRAASSDATVRTALVQIGGAAVLWGTAGIVVQFVRQSTGLSPVSIGFHRLVIAAVVLLLLRGVRWRLLGAALRAAPWILVLSGVALGAYQALYFLAVAYSGVSVATVVSLGVAPVSAICWEAVRARRMPQRRTMVVLAAAVAGLVLITLFGAEPHASAPRALLGLLAAFGSGLGYAATIVMGRHLPADVAPMTLTTTSATIGALTLAPFALLAGIAFEPEIADVVMLLHLGVVTTAVAYGLFYAGLRNTAGSSAAVVTLLEALTAAVLAVVVLDEPLPVGVLVGAALLLGAITAIYLTPQRREA